MEVTLQTCKFQFKRCKYIFKATYTIFGATTLCSFVFFFTPTDFQILTCYDQSDRHCFISCKGKKRASHLYLHNRLREINNSSVVEKQKEKEKSIDFVHLKFTSYTDRQLSQVPVYSILCSCAVFTSSRLSCVHTASHQQAGKGFLRNSSCATVVISQLLLILLIVLTNTKYIKLSVFFFYV